jgi:hypothetical protein
VLGELGAMVTPPIPLCEVAPAGLLVPLAGFDDPLIGPPVRLLSEVADGIFAVEKACQRKNTLTLNKAALMSVRFTRCFPTKIFRSRAVARSCVRCVGGSHLADSCVCAFIAWREDGN